MEGTPDGRDTRWKGHQMERINWAYVVLAAAAAFACENAGDRGASLTSPPATESLKREIVILRERLFLSRERDRY